MRKLLFLLFLSGSLAVYSQEDIVQLSPDTSCVVYIIDAFDSKIKEGIDAKLCTWKISYSSGQPQRLLIRDNERTYEWRPTGTVPEKVTKIQNTIALLEQWRLFCNGQ